MVVMVSTQPCLIWRPNQLMVVAFGLVATLIFCMALVMMFVRQVKFNLLETPIDINLISHLEQQRARVEPELMHRELHEPSQTLPKPVRVLGPITIPPPPIEPLSPPIDWQQQIEMSVNEYRINNPNPLRIMSNRPLPISPLQQALNAPRKPETMQNGESYRSIYGGVMLKSGGLCSELQTIQIGPSPTNRVTIAFPGQHCAGDAQPSMADDLSKWVDQEAKKHPPP